MKKFIIFILLLNITPVFAQSYYNLDKLENSMFGITYPEQNEKSRIERLEKNIYGAIQTGNLKTRLEHLSKDLNADLIGQEPESQETFDFEEKEDNTVNYPIINEFEKKLFNQEFKNKNIKQRLSNLEKKVFNKTFEKEDLSTRTDRLKTAINVNTQPEFYNDEPKDFNNFTNYQNELAQIENEHPNFSEKFKDEKYDKNVAKILNALEKKIFKKTYPNDNEENRIERLEENMFSTSFPQDKIESRLERLALAYQATKTSKKYDTNKLSQHMATAMQVGMFLLMILAMVL